MRWIASFAVVVMLAGCSFVGVRGPSKTSRCTSSDALPIVDTVLGSAGLFTGLAVTAAYLPSNDLGKLWVPIIGLPALLVGGVYAGSAVYGFRRTRACRAANGAG